jgi:hypothetical protein
MGAVQDANWVIGHPIRGTNVSDMQFSLSFKNVMVFYFV